MHPNRLHSGNFESFVQQTEPNAGFAKAMPLFAGQFVIVTDEGDLSFAATETGTNDLYAFRWNNTGTTDDILVLSGAVPMDYDPLVDKLQFLYRVRKLDTTGLATDNTDLAITHSMIVLDSDDTAPRSVTISNHTLAAKATDDDLDAFELVTIDLSGNGLHPGDPFSLALSVNEAVGTALRVDMLGHEFRYMANASLNDRSLRHW